MTSKREKAVGSMVPEVHVTVSPPAEEDEPQKNISENVLYNDNGSRKNSIDFTSKSRNNSYVDYGKDSPFLKAGLDHPNANYNRRRRSSDASVLSYSIVPPLLILPDCVTASQEFTSHKEEEEKRTFRSALPEILASCSATSFHIIVGVTFACTSSMMPLLEADDSDIKATKSELAWIASIIFIILPVASILAGIFMETFGRLNSVRLAVIPSIVSCVLIALASNIYMIIAGRLLFGIGAALGINPAIVYVAEITSPEYRGALISSGPTLASLGMMIGYAMGAFLPWRTVSWINILYCLIPVVMTIFFFIPESPSWLVSKNRIDQAKMSLNWLAKMENPKKKDKIIERKLKELIKDKEQKMAAGRGQTSFWRKLSALKKPTGYKPLFIMIVLFFFQQYTGVYITTFYIVQYFEEAGSKMNPFHASILVGLTRFIMSVVTVGLLKRFGRRPLCFASCIGMGTFAAISGYCTHEVLISGQSSMMPVFTIMLFVAFSMFGLLSLPWTMSAEVFPTEIRGIAHGLVMATAHSIMFVSLQTYYEMAEFFGGHDGLQWFFAAMCGFSLIFIYFFLPETHGRTLLEIETYFENRTVYSRRYSEDCRIIRSELAKRRKWSTASSTGLDRKHSMRPLSVMEALEEHQAEYDSLAGDENENEKFDKKTEYSNTEKIDKTADELDKILIK